MEKKNYTDGQRTIRATETAYEILYKNQGFKPIKAGGENDKSGGNRNNKTKNSADNPAGTTVD